MEVQHFTKGGARVWQHCEPGFAALATWSERIAGHGEDADPLVVFRRSEGRGVLAVCDGLGGAGRTIAGRTVSGAERTQAWLAARRVRGLIEEWFVGDGDPRGLGRHVALRLAEGVTSRTRMRGSMHQDFPTTLACLDYRVDADTAYWDVLWAGDSRCYVVEPDHGLQQLSLDDAHCTDALELLVQGPPMTNMVSAGRPFVVRRLPGSAPLPCMLVCATDGFFDYLATPAEFEDVLLQTLVSAQDMRHWGALLAAAVESYTGDDASLAMVALGFDDLADLRAHFVPQARRVHTEHAEPMSIVPQHDRIAVVAARERSWQRYRPGYERRLPTRQEVGG
jgi:serine/threonine protein phosphatase PrpC